MGDKDAEPLDALMREKNYKQTYVIMKPKKNRHEESKSASSSTITQGDANEVLFQCGNWSYRGNVQFNGLKLVLKELPVLIAALQKQQGMLRYYCNSNAVPADSYFYEPLSIMTDAANFFGQQMTSVETEDELEKLSKTCPWINDDSSTTYFELSLDSLPQSMDNICMIASKTYVRGLIIISVYFEGSILYMIQSGEGDQALLDVRFPDVTRKGQGMHLASYAYPHLPYTKLTLWLLLDGGKDEVVTAKELPKIRTISVSTKNYQQTYCILKSAWEGAVPQLSVHHDVLFRFGSWCYAGRVQLIPSLSLGDLPFVIPALRMQQSRLEYLCDAGNVPTTSAFAGALDFIQKLEPIIEQLIEQSSDALVALIDRLSRMGVGDAVSQWLEGDPKNSFFEFKMNPDDAMFSSFNAVELVASKSYHASGVITTLIMYQYAIYVCLSDGSKENPLLDSSFPDIAGKGRGYQIQAYSEGIPEWPTLRKVSVWQTVGGLEQEFNNRAAAIAQGKAPVSGSACGSDIACLEATASSKDCEVKPQGTSSSSSSSIIKEVEKLNEDLEAEPELDVPVVAEEKDTPADEPKPTQNKLSAASSSVKLEDDSVKVVGREVEPATFESSRSARPENKPVVTISSSFTPGKDQFSSTRMARPHHLPKMESLSRKLDEIKKTMGEGEEEAPWDASGRPVLGSNLTKK